MRTKRFQMLALDVDGTLLDRDGTLRPRTLEAVTGAARAGIRPVLCTGRRYRRAWPIALELQIDAPLVCNSGAIIKDPASHGTIWRADFDRALSAEVLDLFRSLDEPAVVFTDRGSEDADFIIAGYPTGRSDFDDYIRQNLEHAEIRERLWINDVHTADSGSIEIQNDCLFHVCAIGSRARMLEFEAAAHRRIPGRVQTFVQRSVRYSGTMCEILRHDAGKWAAILHLAELWQIDPTEICAVGDEVNDIPMIRHAGLGVAMGHARPEVRAVADLVTSDHDEDGVASLIEKVLLG
jgi:Cof subfamily protein (haloacid dehalogenase superfamily)